MFVYVEGRDFCSEAPLPAQTGQAGGGRLVVPLWPQHGPWGPSLLCLGEGDSVTSLLVHKHACV